MLRSKKDIIENIDSTLDQLIENSKILTDIADNPLYSTEYGALSKTQESLLAHLVNMDELLHQKETEGATEVEKVEEKIEQFTKDHSSILDSFKDRNKTQSFRLRRRKKVRATTAAV